MGCKKVIQQSDKRISALKKHKRKSLHKLINPLQRRIVNKPQANFNLWAKFDTVNFDGIHILSYLNSNENLLDISNIELNVYSVDTSSSWLETLLFNNSYNLIYNKFTLALTSLDLNNIILDSELTLAIEIKATRSSKNYYKKVYINHLGTYESIIRLQQDVEFLDITKLDE